MNPAPFSLHLSSRFLRRLCHGLTCYHADRGGGTLQIGEGSVADALARAPSCGIGKTPLSARSLTARGPIGPARIAPFDVGVCGCTAMLVTGSRAKAAGISKRKFQYLTAAQRCCMRASSSAILLLPAASRMPTRELAEICMTSMSFPIRCMVMLRASRQSARMRVSSIRL